ncbi:jg9061, partial [Pararge aegeria aegeria]
SIYKNCKTLLVKLFVAKFARENTTTANSTYKPSLKAKPTPTPMAMPNPTAMLYSMILTHDNSKFLGHAPSHDHNKSHDQSIPTAPPTPTHTVLLTAFYATPISVSTPMPSHAPTPNPKPT